MSTADPGVPGTRESPPPVEDPDRDGEDDERRDPRDRPPAGDPPPQRPPIEPPAPPRRRGAAGACGGAALASEHAPRIEVGWLIAQDLDRPQIDAVENARDCVLALLRRDFPRYEWNMPLVTRRSARESTNESVLLLDEGIQERAQRHWDFCLVIAGRDLRSYEKPFTIAAPSRAVGVAVLSLARLDGREASAPLATRIGALALHLFADLNGIAHAEDVSSFAFAPRQVADLDAMRAFDESRRRNLADALDQVADKRVEEEADARYRGRLSFFLRSLWVGRRDIASSIVQAEPWAFPLRLGRLSAAALSAMMILLMTAEVWDVAARQSASLVGGLAVTALVATSTFILRRQNLLIAHGPPRRSEQTVVANTAVSLVVALGMTVTFAVCLAVALAMSALFFSDALVADWVTGRGAVDAADRLVISTFVASLAIVIGALGASFEGKHYFRHTTFIDEET